jgi:hypothetical protein
MDPKEALEKWRAACAVINNDGHDPDDTLWSATIDKVRSERLRDAREDKREARIALLGWLRMGGFEPKWKNKRERSFFIA